MGRHRLGLLLAKVLALVSTLAVAGPVLKTGLQQPVERRFEEHGLSKGRALLHLTAGSPMTLLLTGHSSKALELWWQLRMWSLPEHWRFLPRLWEGMGPLDQGWLSSQDPHQQLLPDLAG